MNAVLIICISIAISYLSNRLSQRGAFRLIDAVMGVVGGLIGLSVAQQFGASGTTWGVSLPLLIACALTLGLSRSRPVIS